MYPENFNHWYQDVAVPHYFQKYEEEKFHSWIANSWTLIFLPLYIKECVASPPSILYSPGAEQVILG